MSNSKYINESRDEGYSYSKNTLLSNYGCELFNEYDSKIVNRVIGVKRVSLPKDGENWEIIEDDSVMFIVKGIKLSKKERKFLYTLPGINLLINQFKHGNLSISSIKKRIKELTND